MTTDGSIPDGELAARISNTVVRALARAVAQIEHRLVLPRVSERLLAACERVLQHHEHPGQAATDTRSVARR